MLLTTDSEGNNFFLPVELIPFIDYWESVCYKLGFTFNFYSRRTNKKELICEFKNDNLCVYHVLDLNRNYREELVKHENMTITINIVKAVRDKQC